MQLHLKDYVSLANACSGFLALPVFFLFGYFSSLALVVLAVAFDFLDGIIARKDKAHNEFGKQLDSLADAVSFGVVPPILVFFFHSPASFLEFFALLLGGLFFLSAALIRLAEYNLQKESGFYYGFPSPLAAFLLLLLGWIGVAFAVFLLFLLAGLMLSKFKLKKVF